MIKPFRESKTKFNHSMNCGPVNRPSTGSAFTDNTISRADQLLL